MATAEELEHVRALTSWGKRRRALESERDPLVLRALSAGVSIEAIHQFTGLGRTTIERIREKGSK